MSIPISKSEKKTPVRIESIDVLRGIIILLMIFVNDISGVAETPFWLKHMHPSEDGMTIPDLVFPAFLFIVGMSMPFSIRRKLDKNADFLGMWKHIIVRTFGLIVIGFFMVNSDAIADDGILEPNLWIILMYLCIMIIWNIKTPVNHFITNRKAKLGAVIGLIILAFIYSGESREGIMQMRTSWWGILGLIGWAYFVACLFYIPFRKNLLALTGSILLLYFYYMTDEIGTFENIISTRNFIHASYTFGTHSGLILSGVLLGDKIREYSKNNNHSILLRWATGYSLFVFVAFLLLHQLNDTHEMFIISKLHGTIPWALLSTALTIWIWMIIYWLVDIRGIKKWTKIVEPAGANPLFAYILAPFVISIIALTEFLFGGFNFYYWLGDYFILGLARAVIIAFTMTWLTGYLSNKGLQLKL